MTELEYIQKIKQSRICKEHHIKFTKICHVCGRQGQKYTVKKFKKIAI